MIPIVDQPSLCVCVWTCLWLRMCRHDKAVKCMAEYYANCPTTGTLNKANFFDGGACARSLSLSKL